MWPGDCRHAVDGKFTSERHPRIFIGSTHMKPEITEGGLDINLRVLGLTIIITADLARFTRKLLAYAHCPLVDITELRGT